MSANPKINLTALCARSSWELIGQDLIKDNLQILIEAAKLRSESLDHVLFTVRPDWEDHRAHLANEMGVSIKVTSGPAIERAGDLAAILTNLHAR